jgi:hypothetical protein
VVALDAAKEWGVPPWDIGGGTKLTWWYRFEVRREIEIQLKDIK